MSKRFLVFLIPAFIASLIYGYLQMPQQERVTTRDGKAIQRPQVKKQQQGQKSATIGSDSYPRLRTDLLERKSQPYPGVHRDLFSSAFDVSPSEERIEILAEESSEIFVPPVVVVPPPPPPPPSTPQEVAQQELAHYKFVGFLKKGEKKTIFISTGDEVLLVRKGDYLGRDRKYYVVNITDTTLELHKEGAGNFSIKLTDQESLSPVFLQGQNSLGNGSSSLRPIQEMMNLPVQSEFMTVPDEESPNQYQLQPEEVNQ
jgi:hypothetical protein